MPLCHRLTGAILGAVLLFANHPVLASSGGGVAVNEGHITLPPNLQAAPHKHSHHKHTPPAASAGSGAQGK